MNFLNDELRIEMVLRFRNIFIKQNPILRLLFIRQLSLKFAQLFMRMKID